MKDFQGEISMSEPTNRGWWRTPNPWFRAFAIVAVTLAAAVSIVSIWSAPISLGSRSGQIALLVTMYVVVIVVFALVLMSTLQATPAELVPTMVFAVAIAIGGNHVVRGPLTAVEDAHAELRNLAIADFVDRLDLPPQRREAMAKDLASQSDAALCNAGILSLPRCPSMPRENKSTD